MKRKLRSSLDLLFPTVQERVEDRQAKQKAYHDGEKPLREFALNDRVYVENFPTKKPRWIAGTIVKITGPLSYEVELINGSRVRRHVDSVRRREEEITFRQESHPMLLGPESVSEPVEGTQTQENSDRSCESGESSVSSSNPPPRCSIHSLRPPDHFGH